MSHTYKVLSGAIIFAGLLNGQAPSVSQVLMYSATAKPGVGIPAGTVPSIFTQNVSNAFISDFAAGLGGDANSLNKFVGIVTTSSNYKPSRSLIDLNNALNGSIATALSIVPLASPASGVIVRTDPSTGIDLPVSSTLGPIFTERAETIGKGKFYVGFSHQDTHFTSFNGQSLNALNILYPGGDPSKIFPAAGSSTSLTTVPATFSIGMDVRLKQDIAFLTYGATDRFDITLGLPMVHSQVGARTFNGTIYAGTGFGNPQCWCVDTFTPGAPLLQLPIIGDASKSATGFGDLLVRLKGTVLSSRKAVVAVGTDLRFPTGDAKNYLGVGATSWKPWFAVSMYSQPMKNGIVVSPHFDLGYQYTGKSILGGTLSAAQTGANPSLLTGPFTATKDNVPDVFSWAFGTEIAFGRHNTLIMDLLGNQIGLAHGIPDATQTTLNGQFALPTSPTGTPQAALGGPTAQPSLQMVNVGGLTAAPGRVSYGQYSLAFGYKARLVGNLVATVNVLVRLDDNGLTSRFVPQYGLGYSF